MFQLENALATRFVYIDRPGIGLLINPIRECKRQIGILEVVAWESVVRCWQS